jgi:hypothetical protein
MQFKGLLMTQAPLAKLPGCTFGFYHLSALKSRFSSRRRFFAFLLRRKWSGAFFYPSGPGF